MTTERILLDASVLTGWRKSSYSGPEGGDCVEVADGYTSAWDGWRKSSYSGSAGGSCVEVADGYPVVPVRDSKVPHGPALVFPAATWSTFVQSLKDDQPA
ncbi:DUF397 domain-containing protein [Streptomyces sp. NPDC048057]|uniref:DUF397 domain-containing protein n=1 Tax=Streptomyces sp. NPDC048057 TaxID=3155628 RepID=UPI0034046F5F